MRGLKMGEDHIVMFKSDILFLRIISLGFGTESDDTVAAFSEPEKAKVFTISMDEAEKGVMRFSIWFSLPLSVEAKMEITHRISLTPFFPVSLGPMYLRSARWHGDDRLFMEWEDPLPGKPEEPYYYRLALPGGRSGISNGEGSYLKEETYFYIEVAKK
jgi:hypothetical protein